LLGESTCTNRGREKVKTAKRMLEDVKDCLYCIQEVVRRIVKCKGRESAYRGRERACKIRECVNRGLQLCVESVRMPPEAMGMSIKAFC
jgi:hypothetical protein